MFRGMFRTSKDFLLGLIWQSRLTESKSYLFRSTQGESLSRVDVSLRLVPLVFADRAYGFPLLIRCGFEKEAENVPDRIRRPDDRRRPAFRAGTQARRHQGNAEGPHREDRAARGLFRRDAASSSRRGRRRAIDRFFL